jgi:hypothetical protein
MQRFLIQCVNGCALCTIFLGLPAVAGVQFGSLRLSSVLTLQKLLFWGLSLAAAANAVAALAILSDRKSRKLCLAWTLAFGGLLGIQFALARGFLNFDWLKQTLLWLQQRL